MLNDEKNLENQEEAQNASENLEQNTDAVHETPQDQVASPEETQTGDVPVETAESLMSAPTVAEPTPEPVDDVAASSPATEEAVAPPATDEMAPSPASDEAAALHATDEAEVSGNDNETSGKDLLAELVKDEIQEDNTPHDQFDWDSADEERLDLSDERVKELAREYESKLQTLTENQIVDGVVREISGRDVVIDLNYKADGIVSLTEFRDTPDLKPGDTVAVYVEKLEDEKGQLVLSRRKAKILRAWESLVKAYNDGSIVTGTVVSMTRGGLIVNVDGLDTFLPGSQVDIRPVTEFEDYVGKTMEFKVVKINEAIKNAVVSHKALIESDLAEQREKIVASLERGQVLEGIVKNITDFGAFLDLGGVDGLLHNSDISWGRSNYASDVLKINQKLNVVVMDFDEDKKRISLSLKALQPHPWDVLDESIQEGSVVKGKVVNIADYGAFLEITPGVEGLVHVSEVTWSSQPVNAKEYFKLGEVYDAKVVTVDREAKKMSLSIKQLTPDPWDSIEERFAEGTKHKGVVKNLTPYGVFVELAEGIGGMIHISDLSWLKRYSHPSEFTKVGEEIDVIVLEIDKENRKLSLGHKQLEENPWDTFESVFPVGSYHQGTIVRKDEKGAIVQLPYGLEAFAPIRHIKKENGKMAEVGEELTFKVLEFDRDDKRILVSHLRYLDDIRREAGEMVKEKQQKERTKTRNLLKKHTGKKEVSRLGELEEFEQLRKQLEQSLGAAGQPELAAETAPPAPEPEAPEADVAQDQPEAPTEADSSAEQVAEEATGASADTVEETTHAEEAVAQAESGESAAEALSDADAEGDDTPEGETPVADAGESPKPDQTPNETSDDSDA